MTAYRKPPALVVRVFNPIVNFLVGRLGLDLGDKRTLEVRGRRSGEWRGVPVNMLSLQGKRYLVSPRGETQWVRNLRAADEGRLRLGNQVEEFIAREMSDAEKLPILRAYLERWSGETRGLFAVRPDGSDEDFRRAAPDHPIFEIEPKKRG